MLKKTKKSEREVDIKPLVYRFEVTEKDEWCVEAYLETNYDEFTFEDYETTVKKYLMFNFMDMTGMAGGDEENEDL